MRKATARPGGREAPASAPAPERRDRVLVWATAMVLALIALTVDDRHVGQVADGRQMIRTAIAIAETGEIGQAAGRDFTLPRAAGDAVSRFGMATSLLQVPAAWLAPTVERWRGVGSSQALFLIVPWLGVGFAAWCAGRAARALGADDRQTVASVLLASLASPLASYAAMEFSEPVQAAAMAAALTAALIAARAGRPRPGLELLAGFAAGCAVLAKSSLVVAAPALLLPLVDLGDRPRSLRALGRAALGALPPLSLWLGFELVRFGRLFGGYPDDGFTHPWLDGLWRLLVGPNRGFLLFFPALILFAVAGRRWIAGESSSAQSRAWLGAALATAAQLAVTAGYWGWHGMEGWGPRLVLAATPLLAPFAATALTAGRRPWLYGFVALGLLANLPPLVQHPTPVATYVTNCVWPEIPAAAADRFPFYARSTTPAGRPTVVPFARLELEPAANPWRLYLWFRNASRLDDEALAGRLASPPWLGSGVAIAPAAAWPPAIARQVAPRPRWGFLGRSLTGAGGPYARVYAEGLRDQVVRAQQLGRVGAALELSDRLVELWPTGENAAWHLESLRLAGRRQAAADYLATLPRARRAEPMVNLVLALFDRDGGIEARARALLGSVAGAFPGTPVERAVDAPLAEWPASLDRLLRVERRDALVDSATVGVD